jgi:adenylate cyclase
MRERIRKCCGWLVALGTEGYPPRVQRRLRILNVVAYLVAFFTFAYALQHIFVDHRLWAPVIVINLALAGVALLVPLAHRISDIAGGLMIAIAEWTALFFLTAYLGRSSGIHIQYAVGAAASFVILGLDRLKLIAALVLSGMVLHIAAWLMFPEEAAWLPVPEPDLNAVYVTAAVTTFGLIAATVYYAFHLAERAEAETDALLRNILPDSIVDRLKQRPDTTIADTFAEASVLFADLKGFVGLAKQLGPPRTVEFLSALMTEFDELAARHGVEKIKTIGDAYMAAAGVPHPVADHAERLARFGLDMLVAVDRAGARVGSPLEARIGMASGLVMAGLIGAKRVTYDVWGDTVNLAARLESAGEAGRVHVSESTKTLLEKSFALEPHGLIDIRGFGREQTWYLVGPPRRRAEEPAKALTPSPP